MPEKEYKLEQWTDNSLYYSFPNGNLHHSISNVLTRVEKDLNALHEENMNNRAEITRFKLIVSDIVDDLEKQAKSEEAIVISMDYVDWIKSELDLKLNGLKR